MRVIKNGFEETIITCQECASELAYTQKDLNYNDVEICGLLGTEISIKCPVCSNEIIVRTIWHSVR